MRFKLTHLAKLGALGWFWTMLPGFVIMSKARLPITPANPTFTLSWDGRTPHYSNADIASYAGGIYEGMSDEAITKEQLDKAAAEWGAVYGTYLQFKVEQVATPLEANATDGINAILVENMGDLTISGYTVPTASTTAPYNGTIVTDCDIHLNVGDNTLEGFMQTAAHEMGHCVGLGHPHTNYEALMSYARDFPSPKLADDDIAGLLYLYTDPSKYDSTVHNLIPIKCGTVAGDSGSSPLALALLLLLPLAPWALCRAPVPARRKRRHIC